MAYDIITDAKLQTEKLQFCHKCRICLGTWMYMGVCAVVGHCTLVLPIDSN